MKKNSRVGAHDVTKSEDNGFGLDRRGFFRGGAAALGGLSAAGLLRAQAAELGSAPQMQPTMGSGDALTSHSQRVTRWTGAVPANWVRPRSNVDHNVVIVGGGQTGLSIAFGLRRKGIGQVEIIEQAGPGEAGIWKAIARMRQLRTPKLLQGPEQGNAALGFRAWFEAQNGPAAFDALDRIPRVLWADYLAWYEQTSGAQTRYRTRLLDIEPVGDVLRLHLISDGVTRTETTRKLILANGYNGAGGASVPGFLRALPAQKWSHTEKPINFDALKGKTIGILGAGASAFDAAGVALETGASEVHLFSRRSYIDYTNGPPSQAARPPVDRGFPNQIEWSYVLPDAIRWRSQLVRERAVATVPFDSLMRAVSHDKFRLHLDSSWDRVAMSSNGKVRVQSRGKDYRFDYVIAATGYQIDLAAQPELTRIHQSIALWRDRYQPDVGESDQASGAHPYLGTGFQFIPRAEKDGEFLRNIHCVNLAAAASFNILVGDVPSMVLQPQLIATIARDFMLESANADVNKRSLQVPPVPADPTPYQPAINRS